MKQPQTSRVKVVLSSLLYLLLPVIFYHVIVTVHNYLYYKTGEEITDIWLLASSIDIAKLIFMNLISLFTAPFWISLLLLPLYVFLFRRGWLSVLLSAKNMMILSTLLIVLLMFSVWVVEIKVLDSKPGILGGPMLVAPMFVVFPVLLALSAQSFIFYGKKVGNCWMFSLAIIESLFIYTLPFIWVPMIIYYPIMRWITLKYRIKLIKERRIRTPPQQSFKEYLSGAKYFYGLIILFFLFVVALLILGYIVGEIGKSNL